MKKFFPFFVLFVTSLASAQISVESFRLLENDLTAITNGTQETDQNGEVAALIKVVTTQKGFTFDGGMLGIVKTMQQTGEIWVYVPRKLQRITISHPDLGVLRDYYFQIPIEGARTYELKLTTSRVKTIIEEDAGGGYLALKVNPSTAIVYVDEQVQALNEEGMLSLFLLYGEHTYRIEAQGYKTEYGKVKITSDDTQTLTISLISMMGHLTLSTSMEDTEIWVNNERKGIGEWSGFLAQGVYVLETRKAGHRSRRTTLTLAEKEDKTIMLPDPEPIFGRLRVESNPLEAEVWLDDKKIGKTPGIINDILVGNHVFYFTKEGYQNKSVEVTIEEGKIATTSVVLKKNESELKNDKQKVEKKESKRFVVKETQKGLSSTSIFFHKNSVYLGAYYSFGCPSSLGGTIGVYWGNFNIEGSYEKALGKGIDVDWYYLEDDDYSSFTMTYTPFSFISGNIGYGIHIGKRIRLTPRIGAGALSIIGENETFNQKTYILSSKISFRADYALFHNLSIYVSPMYGIPLKWGETANYLRNSVTDFVRWNSGAALQTGISLNF